MRNGRIIRSLAVLASAGLIVGAFVAAPAEAAKKKKPKGCAAYVPGENGADLEVTKVTNANTADAPATVELELGPGLGVGRNPAPPPEGEGMFVSHAYANLQVDPTASSDLLNIKVAWTNPAEDFDLYLDAADGTELASSGGVLNQTFGSEYAQTDFGYESIIGYPVSDCEGFTIDVAGAGTPGGTVTVTYWLGE